MTIGMVSKATGLSTSCLRFYEGEKLITAARGQNGYRIYPPETIDRLRFIEGAKKLGFTLEEIRQANLAATPPHLPNHAILTILQTKLHNVEQHLAETRQRRDQLRRLIRRMETCQPKQRLETS